MIIENLEQLPMTELESTLKDILNKRPEIQNKILSAQELSDYITWMAENFGKQVQLTTDSISAFAAKTDIANLGRELIARPGERKVLSQLSAMYTNQREERFIAGGYDISVFRMFRYMPSHWHTNTYFEIYYSFSGECPVYFQDEVVTVKPADQLCIRLKVKIIGEVAGDEVVQLYLRDCQASMTRTVKELVGFGRIHLEPGEEKQITFTLKVSQTAFWFTISWSCVLPMPKCCVSCMASIFSVKCAWIFGRVFHETTLDKELNILEKHVELCHNKLSDLCD